MSSERTDELSSSASAPAAGQVPQAASDQSLHQNIEFEGARPPAHAVHPLLGGIDTRHVQKDDWRVSAETQRIAVDRNVSSKDIAAVLAACGLKETDVTK